MPSKDQNSANICLKLNSKKGGAYSARERTVTYAPQFNFAVGTTVLLAHGLDRT